MFAVHPSMFAEYIRLTVSRLGLPSEYDYWLAEYSPIIPQKSITTSNFTLKAEAIFSRSHPNTPFNQASSE